MDWSIGIKLIQYGLEASLHATSAFGRVFDDGLPRSGLDRYAARNENSVPVTRDFKRRPLGPLPVRVPRDRGANSTISPSCRMAMRWHSEAIDSRSCEIYKMAMDSSRLSRANRRRISDWVSASRALVASSAISSAGGGGWPWRCGRAGPGRRSARWDIGGGRAYRRRG